MDKLESIMLADDGFNDLTIMKLLSALLNDLKIPVTSIQKDHVRFKPIGASTYGGYIYKSGVIVIFNEHFSPMITKTTSLREALKLLCRKSKFAYLPLYNAVCRYRTLYLLATGKVYEDVYGYDAVDGQQPILLGDVGTIVSELVSDDEISCYVDTRIPFKDSVYTKKISGETTIWDLAKLIRGVGAAGKALKEKTRYARRIDDKMHMPVILPNFHLAEMDGKFIKIPNNTVMLDFDLDKQGFDILQCARIRAIVEGMGETILVSASYTKGNFWAIMAASHPKCSYERLALGVMEAIEGRFDKVVLKLDKTSGRMNQMRFVLHDKYLLVKHPTMRFVDKS